MTISDSTLTTDVWDDIRTALVAASIATTIGATVTSANVTNAHPDKFTSKPQIVILPVTDSKGEFPFGGTYGKSVINVVIECYHNTTLGVSQLKNQVDAVLLPNSVTGINLVETNSDYSFDSPGENKMHLITLVYSYERTSHA